MRNKKNIISNISPIKYSEASETFRNNIAVLSANVDLKISQSKIILITGAEAKCGTTSIAAALAEAENSYNKTLLIDANFRNPATNKIYQPTDKGLSDYIVDKADAKDAIIPTPSGLDYMGTGNVNDKALATLLSGKMVEKIEQIKLLGYDCVIIDSPSLDFYDDATVLGAILGNAVLVVEGTTPKKIIRNAFEKLDMAKINVLGMVMNKKG